ncbi:hypothetical protein JOD29_001874 [Lysinibacillus composti]|uniref:hypothetical protein n=1 Tax=Lysinibacillus composti TaxID=720633 RepID=UPI0013153AFD|nr:hypothetical protein [Lysinibacillus composti]MBM7608627.1 hypothetical protein [Lysinibacillus composti]
MKKSRILEDHLKYKDKSMSELITERNKKLSKGQNDLRKKWLPEKYNPNLDKK